MTFTEILCVISYSFIVFELWCYFKWEKCELLIYLYSLGYSDCRVRKSRRLKFTYYICIYKLIHISEYKYFIAGEICCLLYLRLESPTLCTCDSTKQAMLKEQCTTPPPCHGLLISPCICHYLLGSTAFDFKIWFELKF